MIDLPPWETYPKKLKKRLQRLVSQGRWTEEEAAQKGMRLAIGKEANVVFYWLVDPQDGILADVRFLCFGPPLLLGLAEGACDLLLHKTYAQAKRLSADLLEQQVKDRSEKAPPEMDRFLNAVLMAIEEAASVCGDIPVASTYEETPLFGGEEGLAVPDWAGLLKEEKIQWIERILDKEIRPYIELDAGGIELIGFTEAEEVHIRYQGSCTSCHASTGSTLSAIQGILQARLSPSLTVIPEL